MSVLRILIDRHVSLCAQHGLQVSQEEAFGQILAQYLGWERERILKAAAAALKDAGRNEDCERVREMIGTLMEKNGH